MATNGKRKNGKPPDNGKRTRGRPTKLSAETQAQIIEAITAGAHRETAAEYAGIDPAQFYRWLQKGQGPDAPPHYREFHKAVQKAETDVEVRLSALILSAAPKEWTAAMTFLERRHPERWRRRDQVELVGMAMDKLMSQVTEALGEVAEKRKDKGVVIEFADALRKRVATN